jgi:hypothetical protein
MIRIVVGSPNLTQPLFYLGLGPATLEQHRRSYKHNPFLMNNCKFIINLLDLLEEHRNLNGGETVLQLRSS